MIGLSKTMNSTEPTIERLNRQWWMYIGLTIFGAILFWHNRRTDEPTIFALLALIPLLALRGAWKSDRKIVAMKRKATEQLL
jgi:hypothetical protein